MDTPARAYFAHYRDDINSLHPSCSVATPTPMETDGDGEVRTVTYREDRGPSHRDNHHSHRDRAQREARRDRERRRDDRHRGERDQEREREANRRQRDRGDRAYRTRNQGPPRK